MLYLRPSINQENPKKQILKDDHFWQWMHREFKAKYYKNEKLNKEDVIINSSVKLLDRYDYNIINFHTELMYEMYTIFNLKGYKDVSQVIINNCKTSKLTIVPSTLMVDTYKSFSKNIEVVPLGLNEELFKPLDISKKELREKYQLPIETKIGFWSGNDGIWRGWDDLVNYAKNNPEIFWIINYYRGTPFNMPNNKKIFFRISQKEINELYNASDFYLCTNKLGPYYMSDLEAIAAECPIIDTTNLKREFGSNPNREKLIKKGWGRKNCKKLWNEAINACINL